MKAEEYIQQRVGKTEPFRVPTDYFNHFATQLMEQLPEMERPQVEAPANVTLWQRVRPLLYMAALFVGFMLTFRTFLQKTTDIPADATEVVAASDEDAYIEEMLDATMMDDYTIYCYLTDADF